MMPLDRIGHVALLVDPAQLRQAHVELASRLTAALGCRVTLTHGCAQHPLPAALDLLFDLERLVGRRREPAPLVRRIDARTTALAPTSPQDPPEATIDLCGAAAPPAGRLIRVLFDGMAGEAAALAALVAGRMPVITFEEAGPIGRAVPCADNSGSLAQAFECVLARVLTVLPKVLRRAEPTDRVAAVPLAPAPLRWPTLAAFESKTLAYAIVRELYALCFHTPHWRCCWRYADQSDVWSTGTLTSAPWNIVPDPGLRFYADPFPFEHRGRSYLFVEDFDHRAGKATIAVLPFGPAGPEGPAVPVLEEPWHLSYPFLMEHDGEIWMIPESAANTSVALYRAAPFPHRWVREATLLDGIAASDATVVRHDGHFYMFAATRDGAGSWSDTLSIFHAPDLLGPWAPHPGNPIMVDQAAARPAGAMIARDGALWRPVQDCTNGYGTGIGLAEVTRLDREHFAQKVHTVLRPLPDWPGQRLHTLNRHGRLECIDGSSYSPRSRQLGRLAQRWSGRREITQPKAAPAGVLQPTICDGAGTD